MLKKTLCALLCAVLMLTMAACSSAAKEPEVSPSTLPEATADAEPTPLPEDDAPALDDEPTYYTEDSTEYRDLYTNNAIEEALDEDFSNAMSTEDFDVLAKKYVTAWQDEYHVLMDELIVAYPDDAEDLQGLRDYTDEEAQAAYEATYTQHFYIDEDGNEQPAAAAEQNANFDKAEVYKKATLLSILNDYRGDTPYVFHYTAE